MKTKFQIFCALILTALIFTGCHVNSNSVEAESISIKTEPSKTSYIVGEKFDASGLVITETFTDKSTKDITYSEDCGITFKSTTLATSGSHDITVIYDSLETTLTVTINPAVSSIEVKSKPTTVDYTVGDDFDPSGLAITVTYSNKATEDITYSTDSGITLSAPDMTKAGTKKVTVTYSGKTSGGTDKDFTAEFSITVTEKKAAEEESDNKTEEKAAENTNAITVNSIAVKTNPTKTSYFTDDTFDASGLVITVTSSDNSTKDITYSKNSGITLSSPDMKTAGTKTVTVTYSKKTTTFDITLKEVTVSSISISKTPATTLYRTGDSFDSTGLEVEVSYNNNKTKKITSGFTLSAPDMTSIGTKTITVTYSEKTTTFDITVAEPSERNWTKVSSLKETFVDGGFFDRFGLACEEDELGNATTAAGILYHANTTTPGNELKPQFIFWSYSQPAHTGTFTASNGKTIAVPTDDWMKNQMALKMDPYLASAKAAGIQIRGHVLTWHSQTPEFFFTKDYAYDVTYDDNGKPNNLVDEETMTARHEWYIKTVLNHVAEWETANGYAGTQTEAASGKKHLIYTWDVVNEAVADDAADSDTGYLRGSTSGTSTAKKDTTNGCTTGKGSRWYQIYGDDEFIVNAFRFANAYAPSDVTLCYNDYNEYLNYNDGNGGSFKTNGIKRLLTAVMNGSAETVNGNSVKPRIDAMAMQSHVEPSWMNSSSYETALKVFLGLGLDVQVTEFDIATTKEDDKTEWSSYFDIFLKYSKKSSEISKYNGHHITGFTIWGLNDENSWISKNGTQYPLLFTKVDGEYIAKYCFDSVINAAKNYSN